MGLFEKCLCAYSNGRWTWLVITRCSHVPSTGSVGTAWAPTAIRCLAELDIHTAGHSWHLLAAPSAGLELNTGDEPNVVALLTLRMLLLLYIQKWAANILLFVMELCCLPWHCLLCHQWILVCLLPFDFLPTEDWFINRKKTSNKEFLQLFSLAWLLTLLCWLN